MPNLVTRRTLIQKSLMGFGALSVASSLVGCNDDDNNSESAPKVEFLHGVASGDPLQDRVIL